MNHLQHLLAITEEEVPALVAGLEEALLELEAVAGLRNPEATDAIHELLRRLDPERWWTIDEREG